MRNTNKFPFKFTVCLIDKNFIEDLVHNRINAIYDWVECENDKIEALEQIIIEHMEKAFDLGYRLGKTETK